MYSILFQAALAALAIELCAAQTPPQFSPSTSKHLDVTYGKSEISPAGITLPKTEAMDPPSLGLKGATHGKTYLVAMMDLGLESKDSESNSTHLHWILPGLASANDGDPKLTSHEEAIAEYHPPRPRAGQTRTYALILYQEPADFSVPADYVPIFKNMSASWHNRKDFDLNKFIGEAHLGDPIAADWYLVTNTSAPSSSAGPKSSSGAATATTSSHGSAATPSKTSDSAPINVHTVFAIAVVGLSGILFNFF